MTPEQANAKAAEVVKLLATVIARFGALAQPVSNQIIAAALEAAYENGKRHFVRGAAKVVELRKERDQLRAELAQAQEAAQGRDDAAQTDHGY